MKLPLVSVGASVLLALFVSGCATEGTSARIQEKSAVYASLNAWQKKTVEKGDIAVGFTTDMVYMAAGKASSVQTKETEHGQAQLWTYDRFFPPQDASMLRLAAVNSESTVSFSNMYAASGPGPNAYASPQLPKNYSPRSGESSFATGGPQGGTIEPADLQCYKLFVIFVDGKVTRFGLSPI
jgi:hypothetical protein